MFQIGTWNSLSFLNITDDNESLSQLNKTLKVLTVLVSVCTKNTKFIRKKISRLFRIKKYRGSLTNNRGYSKKIKKTKVIMKKRGNSGKKILSLFGKKINDTQV